MRSSSFSSARLCSRFCWRYSVTDIRLRGFGRRWILGGALDGGAARERI
jgi:hypothetical protein